MSGYVQVHVTELFDPGGVVECTWATGVELARAALWGTAKEPPATAAEREALRIAGGGDDHGGSNYAQLAAGCQHRYGWSPSVSTDFPATIPQGYFYGIQGMYHALPTHYQRWDPAFGARPVSPHSSVAYNTSGTVMWCDPLAPPSVRDPKGGTIDWQGEPISMATLRAYFNALPGAHIAVAKVNVPPAGHSLLIPAHALLETARGNTKGQIVMPWQKVTWGPKASSAPCTAAVTKPTTTGGTVAVVKILAGPYANRWAHLNGQVRVVPR